MTVPHPPVLFVTSPGPRQGKTALASGLLRALALRGIAAAGTRPVETGCGHGADHNLVPRDAPRLEAAALRGSNPDARTSDDAPSPRWPPLPPLAVAPYRFALELAPAVAAARAGLQLTLSELVEAVEALTRSAEVLVVEGPAGALSPLTEDALTLDLAAALHATVVLAVEDGPGADAQALATLEAAERRGLHPAALILFTAPEHAALATAESLRRRSGTPVHALSRSSRAIAALDPSEIARELESTGALRSIFPRLLA